VDGGEMCLLLAIIALGEVGLLHGGDDLAAGRTLSYVSLVLPAEASV